MIETSPNDLICNLENIRDICSNYNLVGDVLEFGTFTGFSTLLLSNKFPDKTIFTIDHFKGLEQTNKNIPKDSDWQEHAFSLSNPLYINNSNVPKSIDEVRSRFHHRNNINMIVEDVHKLSHPNTYGINEISICNIDVDIYEPTVSSLEFLTKCKWSEIFIRFDDWHGSEPEYDQHERLVFSEWIEKYNYDFEIIFGGYIGGVYIKR